MKSGSLYGRYFTSLPLWLKKRGKEVYSLPWLVNITIPLDEVYKRLRSSNYLIPQDWLTLGDYITALGKGIASINSIKRNIPYKKGSIDLTKLIQRQKFLQFKDGTSFTQFWIYKPVLIRFTSRTHSINIYSHFEMMPPQHVLTFTINSIKHKKTKTIGYYHSLITKDFLAYHFLDNDEKSKVFPDLVITNGQLSTSILVKQGLPPDRVISGPALRQTFPKTNSRHNKFNKRNAILLVLPLVQSAAYEFIDNLVKIHSWIEDRLSTQVLIKPHPMSKKSDIKSIFNNLGLDKMPKNWSFYEGEIYDALFHSRCAISSNSASIIDTLISGNIPINLFREDDLYWNYLDHLEEEFDILKPIAKNQLKERLRNIFITNRTYYDNQSSAIKNYLLKGLNPITEDNMIVFLENKNEN
tara:strand:- start:1309 stop:2544 length:1236 start_codon:yes stop_codon:yes gene_type:complete